MASFAKSSMVSSIRCKYGQESQTISGSALEKRSYPSIRFLVNAIDGMVWSVEVDCFRSGFALDGFDRPFVPLIRQASLVEVEVGTVEIEETDCGDYVFASGRFQFRNNLAWYARPEFRRSCKIDEPDCDRFQEAAEGFMLGRPFYEEDEFQPMFSSCPEL
jgi:hypothetical protein